MTRKSIFACIAPRNTCWQLGALPTDGELLLLGWSGASTSVDSGIPEDVAALFASALTSMARVNFPVSDVPVGTLQELVCTEKDQTQILGVGGFLERAQALLKGEPSSITLLSTRRKEAAIRLFTDAGYPWHLQGQVALLSKPDVEPPSVDRSTLLCLMDEEWGQHTQRLRAIGVSGVLRPGVDGDVAGVLLFTEEFKTALVGALAQAAELAQFSWSLVSEKEFTQRL